MLQVEGSWPLPDQLRIFAFINEAERVVGSVSSLDILLHLVWEQHCAVKADLVGFGEGKSLWGSYNTQTN